MRRLCLRSIQSPSTSLAKNARSMPRGVRRSISSTMAVCRNEANFRRVMSPFVLPLGDLAVDHEAEPLLEGEYIGIGLLLLIVPGLGHTGETERDQTFVAVVGEHEVLLFQSVVIALAADVAVHDGAGLGCSLGQEGLVEAGLEDRGDGTVARRADVEPASACCFEASRTIGACQREDAETGSEALLGM